MINTDTQKGTSISRFLLRRSKNTSEKEFSSGQTKEYPKSFSCGIVEVEGGNEELQVRDIIKQADHEMYLQKKEHKKKYRKELSVISISED